jgi:predicted nucleotidyltransferase
LSKISQDLSKLSGVIGIVLGGFRARSKEKKDSDFDLGIYYQPQNFDWEKVAVSLPLLNTTNTRF